jgi:GAF domain-containing protein
MNAHPVEGKPSGGPLESAPAAAAPTPSPYPPTEHSELRARVRTTMPGLTAARADQLLQIMTAIGDAVTEQQLFEALVDEVARALGASTAGLWILDETGVRAELVRGVGYPQESRERIASFSLPTAIRLPIIDALQGDTPIFIGSLDELFARFPLTRPYATSGRSYRMACLPLVAQGRNLGALALTGDVLQPDEHEEKEFLLLLAHYATQSLLRLRMMHAERESRQRADAAAQHLALLGRVSQHFAAAELGLEERLRTVAQELSHLLGGSVCIALRSSEDRLHLTSVHHPDPEAQARLSELTPHLEIPLGEGMTGAMAAEGRSLLLPRLDTAGLAAQAAPAYRDFLMRYPIYALIGACLKVSGRVIGTVTVARTREGQTYTADDLCLLEELAQRAALAIDNSRLFQHTLEARRRTAHLYRFASTVVAAERVDQVLEGALDAAEGALDAEHAAVLLFDDSGVMRFCRWRRLSASFRAEAEGHCPWGPSATEPRAGLVEDAFNEPSLSAMRPPFKSEGIGALAFVPLVSDGRLLSHG